MTCKPFIVARTAAGYTGRGAAARQFAAPQNNRQQNQQQPLDSG